MPPRASLKVVPVKSVVDGQTRFLHEADCSDSVGMLRLLRRRYNLDFSGGRDLFRAVESPTSPKLRPLESCVVSAVLLIQYGGFTNSCYLEGLIRNVERGTEQRNSLAQLIARCVGKRWRSGATTGPTSPSTSASALRRWTRLSEPASPTKLQPR